jgi:hypothetical protein
MKERELISQEEVERVNIPTLWDRKFDQLLDEEMMVQPELSEAEVCDLEERFYFRPKPLTKAQIAYQEAKEAHANWRRQMGLPE